MASPGTMSKRAAKVHENDERLRASLESIVLESGWSAVTFTGVAKRAGLTVGAVYARAENPSELGNDLWTHSFEPFLREWAARLVSAVEGGDPSEIERVASEWDDESARSSVLVELVVASLFDDELGEVVGQSVRSCLSDYCVPGGDVDSHRAAVSTLVFSFFLGRALAFRSSRSLPPLTPPQIDAFAGYSRAAHGDIIAGDRVPLTFVRKGSSDDDGPSSLDLRVIEVLGRVGYRRSTIARIARAAGMSKGALFSRFESKAQLIASAAERTVLTPREVWNQYAPVVAAKGPLQARAIFLAEFLRPVHREMWRVNLELAHMALAVAELAPFATPADTLEHTHLGVMLVASFVDGLADLPFAGPFGAGSAT